MGGTRVRRADPAARAARWAWALVLPLAVLTLVGLVVLWPPPVDKPEQQVQVPRLLGTVTAVEESSCADGVSEGERCGSATVRVDRAAQEGADGDPGAAAGESVRVPLPSGPGAPVLDVGDGVVMTTSTGPEGVVHAVVDHQRGGGLWIAGAAFVLAVLAFGRLRGLRSLAGLAVTFGVVMWFVVPAILDGAPPTWVAVVGAAAIMLVVLYLTHGFSLATTVAVAGTLASLALTGLLAMLAVRGLHLSGVTDDITTSVGQSFGVNMQGLLLAGIVIGALGVLDDVTVTQTATVAEVARADRSLGFRALYAAGSRVGRAHIASVVNTIVLAYAGASLPLLLLLATSSAPLGSVLSDQLLAQEIARSVVGTVGIIAAVPITTALAAWVNAHVVSEGPGAGHGHGHGH